MLQKLVSVKNVKKSWTLHITNEEVLHRAGTGRQLLKVILNRQIGFLVHVIKRQGL